MSIYLKIGTKKVTLVIDKKSDGSMVSSGYDISQKLIGTTTSTAPTDIGLISIVDEDNAEVMEPICWVVDPISKNRATLVRDKINNEILLFPDLEMDLNILDGNYININVKRLAKIDQQITSVGVKSSVTGLYNTNIDKLTGYQMINNDYFGNTLEFGNLCNTLCSIGTVEEIFGLGVTVNLGVMYPEKPSGGGLIEISLSGNAPLYVSYKG